MANQDEFFSPDKVDEQIDRPNQLPEMDAQLLASLRALYTQKSETDERVLQTVWKRIERVSAPSRSKQMKGTLISMRDAQIQLEKQQARKRGNKFMERLGVMAAVLILALLLGSMVVVFNVARHTNTPGSHVGGTGTQQGVKPTPGPHGTPGKIVFQKTISVQEGIDVYAMNWSPDGKRLVVGTLQAQSWDATTGKHVVNYGGMNSGSILSVVYSPDGKRVAVTGVNMGVTIYDANTGELLLSYVPKTQVSTPTPTPGTPGTITPTPSKQALSAHVPFSGGTGAYTTAWSPDGKLMATSFFGAYGNIVQVWNTSTGKLVYNYTKHQDTVGSLGWSPDGRYIASMSYDGSVQVWQALTGVRLYNHSSRGMTSVAWSPDGKSIAYLNGDSVEVVNPFTGKVLVTHHGPNDKWGLEALAWSPDGKSIASAGDHIELWDVATSETYYVFTKNKQEIRVLVWSPDGRYIASTDSPETTNSTIQVWEA